MCKIAWKLKESYYGKRLYWLSSGIVARVGGKENITKLVHWDASALFSETWGNGRYGLSIILDIQNGFSLTEQKIVFLIRVQKIGWR